MSAGQSVSRRTMLRSGAALAGAAVVVGTADLTTATRPGAAIATPEIDGCGTWAAAPPRNQLSVFAGRPDKILIHHTATTNRLDRSRTHAQALARSIQRAHVDNGWSDSGQHFTVSLGGYLLEGRHESLACLQDGRRFVVGAHCPGQNSTAVGIGNEGTYTAVGPPAAQYESLVALCAYACRQFGIPASRIFGHRDFVATDCPGDVLYGRLPQLQAHVAARVDGADAIARG